LVKLEDGRTILAAPIEVVEIITLKYFDNSFTLSFSATDYVNPEEDQFTYQMEGFDQEWRLTSPGQHSATYTNLAPGKYTFRLRYQDKESSVKIHVEPPFWQTIWFKTCMVFLISGTIIFIVFLIIRQREKAYRQQVLEANSEILKLKNEKLASEVSTKNSRLMFFSVQMAHKNETLNNIKEQILSQKEEFGQPAMKLIRLLDRELKSEDYWREFDLYFNQVDREFIDSLKIRHPRLTSNDLRMCSLIRLNLNTKEVASLLNITVRGVEQSRYRLKKRLDLENDHSLTEYIISFKGKPDN
jgi:DNA-binding CsgD family transcriptional regulator